MRRPATSGDATVRVTHVIDTLGPGGAERLLVTNLTHLDPRRVHSQVVTVSDADDHWRSAIEALGVPVHSLGAGSTRQLPGAVRRLRRLLLDWDTDVVHTHLQAGNLVGRLAGRSAGVPVVSSLHNPDHEPAVWAHEGFRHPWRQEILRAADAITARACCRQLIAVSGYVADSAARRLHVRRDRMTVIPNPVEHRAVPVPPPPASLGLPSDALVALTVARVVPQKGILDLVAALPLITSDPPLHVVVAGSTANHEHTAAVRQAAADLGVADRVHLLGSRRDVDVLLASADLFVLASRYEGFGIALAEAMAAGVPCVATRIPPFEELVDGGRTGLLAEVASPASLAACIQALTDDRPRARALGQAAAGATAERLDPARLAEALATTYESVAGREGGGHPVYDRRVSCPLCASGVVEPSWWGSTTYLGRTYEYLACRACGSSFCEPMPDEATIEVMYGPSYVTTDDRASDYRADDDVVALLRARPAGSFLDYGCGAGALLADVAATGWTAIGIELDEDVARRATASSGCEVLTPDQATARGIQVDVVHLGDVLEHLPDPAAGLVDALGYLRPGGTVVAQGPLESNANLFLWTLRAGRLRGGRRQAEMPPYHVLLATAEGQERLFERVGLTARRFDVSEIAWPAPPRLQACHNARDYVLYGVRRLSRAVSALPVGRLGNRYLYVGDAP